MTQKLKILIVDDNASTRTTLTDLFAEEGHQIITAPDGKEALDKVDREKPDVVFLDIRLPEVSGYEVCRQMKERKGSPPKVVLYTAYIDAVNAAKAREANADDFLCKTSEFSNFRDIIDKLS